MFNLGFGGYTALSVRQKEFLDTLRDLLVALNPLLLDETASYVKMQSDKFGEEFLEIMLIHKVDDAELGLWIRSEEAEVIVSYGADHWHYGESYGFDENEWVPYAIQKIEEWLVKYFEPRS